MALLPASSRRHRRARRRLVSRIIGGGTTPAKAARVRDSSIERLLKAHRIRRIAAAEALWILRQPPLTVAAGTAEAASAHIRALAMRLKLVNRSLKEEYRRLDALCAKL
jgi:hypothetical protein